MTPLNRSLGRRQFLRGAAGFTLALPFLPSVSRKAFAADPAPPKRFVGFMSLQGQFEENWFPSVLPDQQIADEVYAMPLSNIPGSVSQVIGPQFNGIRDKLTLMLGLDGLSRSFGHNSCFPLTASTFASGGDGGPPLFPNSLDVVLADSGKFYTDPIPHEAIRVLPNTGNPPSWARTTSFSYRNSQSIPSQWDSRVVFDQFFAGASPDQDPNAVDPRERKVLVIDRVKEDFDRLKNNSRLSGSDRNRLEQFVDHIRDVQTRIQAAPIITCDGPVQRTEVSHTEAYSNHIDMIVAALACGLTRIGTLYCYHHASDGIDQGLHSASHGGSTDELRIQATNTSRDLNGWIASRYLELITKMDSIIEPDGSTLLDNSAVLWGNDIGMCTSHYQFRTPVLMAGGLQGKLRTGVCIDYRSRPRRKWAGHEHLGRPYNQLLTSLMAAYGLSPSDWELPGQPGFGDYENMTANYAGDSYARYIGRERDYLPYYYLG